MSSVSFPDSILIVDDQQAMRLLLSGMLRNLGYHDIRQVASGRKAIEVIKTSVLDMIFLDLMMPDMHGLEVLEELRQTDHARQTFVIMQTGSATKENVERAVEFGVGAILVKPYNVEQVTKALSKYREQCQAPGADKT